MDIEKKVVILENQLAHFRKNNPSPQNIRILISLLDGIVKESPEYKYLYNDIALLGDLPEGVVI